MFSEYTILLDFILTEETGPQFFKERLLEKQLVLDTFTEREPLARVAVHARRKQLQLCLKCLSFNKPVRATQA